MEQRELEVAVRTGAGKGVNRKLRKAGRIPAIIYGGGKDTISLSLSPNRLKKALDTKSGMNTLLNLVCEDSTVGGRRVILKEYQVHPVTEDLLHVDLIEVDMSQPLHVAIPVILKGTPVGVTLGGSLESGINELKISALPEHVPDDIIVDVSGLGIGHALHVSDLNLDENITILAREEDLLAAVAAPRQLEEEAPAEEAEGETETPAEGEAPAEGSAEEG